MQQADDFLAESHALKALVESLDDAELERATAFKGWTIRNVLAHLSLWNHAAVLSLQEPAELKKLFAELGEKMKGGGQMIDFEAQWHGPISASELVAQWWSSSEAVQAAFARCDPAQRVPWAGPDMSARSSISARLMETWAHGQEVYDELGVVRENADRIRHIVVLGINTYGWTFKNRGLEPPQPVPFARLEAPSGETWAFNEPAGDHLVEGRAEEFCQVVTQVRNIADTELKVVGASAEAWMDIAQCFAGGPAEPPAPGTRVTRAMS